jgi:predicted TIM-barrel fold metal-dependent hydrolase
VSAGSSPPPGYEAGILDSHCHAWRRWPYPPLVPDEDSRGTIEQLLYEMDTNGVQAAAVVCAAIDNNPDNTAYVAAARERYPGRLHVLADLDCTWSSSYHLPGSASRLRALADRYELDGFTHYLEDRNDGWLRSEEATAVFRVAEQRRLIVSLAASPAWQADLRRIAGRHPSVPVLCHHLGGVTAADGPDLPGLREVLASAAVPNLFVKVSGFHYASERGWDHPWPDAVALLRRIFDAYGPRRLCWGSDFPASRRFCTYRQSLEVVRTHCRFLTPGDLRLVLGETLREILSGRLPAG